MKKKKLEALPVPEKPERGNTVLHAHNIEHKRHTILDVWDGGGHALRYVVTNTEHGAFDVHEKRWYTGELRHWPRGGVEWRLVYTKRDWLPGGEITTQLGKQDRANVEKIISLVDRQQMQKQKRAAEKRQARMREDFKTLPEIPDDFEDFARAAAGPTPIWYKKGKTKATCICGRCGRTYAFKWDWQTEPRRHEPATCDLCGEEGYYEWAGRVKTKEQYENILLMQKTKTDDLVLRIFWIRKSSAQNREQILVYKEEQRIFLAPGNVRRYSDWYAWEIQAKHWGTGGKDIPGLIIYGDIPEGTSMRFFDFKAWLKALDQSHYLVVQENVGYILAKTMITQAKHPECEIYLKTGLEKMAVGILNGCTFRKKKGKTMAERLMVSREGLQEVRKKHGSIEELKWQQAIHASGIKATKDQWDRLNIWLPGYSAEEKMKTLQEMHRFLSVTKIINRTEEYAAEYGDTRAALRHLHDYLNLRQQLEYDMSNSAYLHPRSLRQAHDAMVEERRGREGDLRAKEMDRIYTGIQKRFEKLEEYYGWEKDGLTIRPAKSAGEIVKEGQILHHCVGGRGYLERHAEGKRIILFLRKSPEEPFVTVEIEKKQILQWYGLNDKKPEEERISAWLNEYMKQLAG